MLSKKLASQIRDSLSKEPKINKFVPGGIKLAYVLGSAVSGRVKPDSDFDLAVVVDDVTKITYDQIYKLVSSLSFPKNLDLSIVDKNSSPLFLFQITSTGRCVYKKSDNEKVSFESFVMKNYYDTAHLRKIYSAYLKERFPYAR